MISTIIYIFALIAFGISFIMLIKYLSNLYYKMTDMKKGLNSTLLNDINILDFIDNRIFFDDNKVAIMFKIDQIYSENLNDEQLVSYKNQFQNFLNSLDKEFDYQMYLRKHNNFQKLIEGHLDLNENDDELIERLFEDQIIKLNYDAKIGRIFNYDLYFTVKFDVDYDISKSKNFLEKKEEEELAQVFQNEIMKKIDLVEDKIKTSLTGAGFNIQIPKEQEIIDLIHSHINTEISYNNEFKRTEDLAENDLFTAKDYLYTNDKYFRFITLKEEPNNTVPTLIKRVTNVSVPYDLTINFTKLDRQQQISKYKGKRKRARAMKFDMFTNEVDEQKQANEDRLSQILQELSSNKNLFEVEYLFRVKANSKEELDKNCNALMTQLNQTRGGKGYNESLANQKLFFSSIPANNLKMNNERERHWLTGYVADMLPTYGPPKGVGEPLMLFRNTIDSITHFDPLSEKFPAKHGIIFGSTGSGKSFTMINVLLTLQAFDPIMVIVDKGGSFERLINILNGSYFKVATKNEDTEEIELEHQINPFETTSSQKEKLWMRVLNIMITQDSSEVTEYEKTIRDRAIQKIRAKIDAYDYVLEYEDKEERSLYYFNSSEDIDKKVIKKKYRHLDDKEKTKEEFEKNLNLVKNKIEDFEEKGEFDEDSNWSVANFDFPIISDFVQAIDQLIFKEKESQLEAERNRIRIFVNRWTDNIHGKFLNNRETDFDTSNDKIGIDLEGLSDYEEIMEVFMVFISDIVWNKADIGTKKKKKIFVFDEVWSFLTDIGGKLIEDMYRTFRKKGASVWTLSQSIKDFANSKYAAGIMDNVSFSYVLKQSDNTNFDLLKKTLNLSNANLQQIKQLQQKKGYYSDVFLNVANHPSYVARLVPSPWEYWLATTSSTDLGILSPVYKHFDKDLIDTIDFLARNCPKGYFTFEKDYDKKLKDFNGNTVKTLKYLSQKYRNVS